MLMRGGCQQESAAPVAANDVVTLNAPMPGDNPGLSPESMKLRVQVAETEPERAQGVSEYPGLPAADSSNDLVHGMLYIYEEPAAHSFYESATKFPLTTATLADDGTILEIKHTGPGANQNKQISFEQPARYVLQVRRGWLADRGLGAGDRLELPDPLPRPQTPAEEPAEDPPADSPVQAETDLQS
jgi:hypothetical protein